ncbi:DUF2750 domain-containing protein [Aquimarina megaterium]|uniref:DUF2750 domain-containing protein n=1 Tax=Aquimarina megaterium TaxID=1443666 RepID=UPI00046FF048|nr:DUF2750 domain-containing protein [Aquimarina megaterium]
MIQDSILIKNRHKRFIKTVCNSEIVWGLKNHEGFASSRSVHYEDDDGEPIGIICFWAEKALAKSCIKDRWTKYKVTLISLSDFMENWCIGMGNDGLLVGTEFDQNLFGFEADPYELVLDLSTELKFIGKDLDFQKFQGVNDLENQVKEAFE